MSYEFLFLVTSEKAMPRSALRRTESPLSALPLPPLLEPLFGREEDVRTIAALFNEGARIVTLVGPGGIGKTQLAREVARHLVPALPQGAVLCELGDVQDIDALLRTVAKSAAIR